jgi:hypothetical protein
MDDLLLHPSSHWDAAEAVPEAAAALVVVEAAAAAAAAEAAEPTLVSESLFL